MSSRMLTISLGYIYKQNTKFLFTLCGAVFGEECFIAGGRETWAFLVLPLD
jgi:hypothetical protein